MKTHVTLRGLDDVNDMLKQIAPKQAQNIMRVTIHDMAARIGKDAKRIMPVDDGVMKKATKWKRNRVRNGFMSSVVYVLREAFYWRFLEYGDGPDGVEHAFFAKASHVFRVAYMDQFLLSFGKKFEAAVARARKKNGG